MRFFFSRPTNVYTGPSPAILFRFYAPDNNYAVIDSENAAVSAFLLRLFRIKILIVVFFTIGPVISLLIIICFDFFRHEFTIVFIDISNISSARTERIIFYTRFEIR